MIESLRRFGDRRSGDKAAVIVYAAVGWCFVIIVLAFVSPLIG